MSIRTEIKSLEFGEGNVEMDGLFGEELAGWSTTFNVELAGQEAITGTIWGSPSEDPWLAWDTEPAAEEKFLKSLARFIIAAFRTCVHVETVMVVKPVDFEEVKSEYFEAEEDDEEKAENVGTPGCEGNEEK